MHLFWVEKDERIKMVTCEYHEQYIVITFFFFIQALLGQNEIQFNFLILLSFLKFIFCKGFEIYRSWANFVHVQPYANSLILENDTFNATCLLYVYVISAHSWLTSTKYLNKTFLYC